MPNASDIAATVNPGFLTNIRAAYRRSRRSRSIEVHPHISRCLEVQIRCGRTPAALRLVFHFEIDIGLQFALQIVLAFATPSADVNFPRPAT
jgi:hypothetical protein